MENNTNKMNNNIKDITLDLIEKFRCDFELDKSAKVSQNAVTGHSINDVCTNRDVIQNTDHSFSIKLDEWSVTNQKSSGRW
jgi:aminopeptidase C